MSIVAVISEVTIIIEVWKWGRCFKTKCNQISNKSV